MFAIFVLGGFFPHKSYLWKYRVQPSAVFGTFVVDEPQLAEQHGEHAKMFLQFSQSILVGVGVVSDSIRQLRGTRRNVVLSKGPH